MQIRHRCKQPAMHSIRNIVRRWGRSASSSCARRVQHDSPHMGCVKSWQCDPGCTECLSGPRSARRSRSQAHTNLRHVLRAGALCVARRWRGWRCCRWWRCCETCSPSTPSASPPPRSWRRPCPRSSRPSATMRPSCCTCARPAPLPPALPHQPRARPLMWHPCMETLLLSCVYAHVLHKTRMFLGRTGGCAQSDSIWSIRS